MFWLSCNIGHLEGTTSLNHLKNKSRQSWTITESFMSENGHVKISTWASNLLSLQRNWPSVAISQTYFWVKSPESSWIIYCCLSLIAACYTIVPAFCLLLVYTTSDKCLRISVLFSCLVKYYLWWGNLGNLSTENWYSLSSLLASHCLAVSFFLMHTHKAGHFVRPVW